ncbi:AsnC family protein [Kitasatospora sp. NPDC088779]|uniref:AsnC family protein n=1 Tax=Kitasatospora sp. NPDC088779 TaxID=3154964 RepID=UPI0034166A0D
MNHTVIPDASLPSGSAGRSRKDAAAITAAFARTLSGDTDSLAWAALLCGPGTVEQIAAGQRLPVELVRRAAEGLMQRNALLTRPQLAAAYTAAQLVPCRVLSLHGEDPADLGRPAQALLRLLARRTPREAAAELGLTAATVSARIRRLLDDLQVATLQQATALAAHLGTIRPWDIRPGIHLPLPAPALPEALRPAVEAVAAVLADAPHRAAAQIPRSEQQQAAAAVAHARFGTTGRILVVAPSGPAWELAMQEWGTARQHSGALAGLQLSDRLRAGRKALAEGLPAVSSVRALLDLAGTTQPATVVATPEALPLVTALHRMPGAARWDLIVVADADRTGRRGAPGWQVCADEVVPAAARLFLTSTAPHRLPEGAGTVTVARSAAGAAATGRVRGHRLLAAATPSGTAAPALADVAGLVLETAPRHGLRRVQVVCATPEQCRKLATTFDAVVAGLTEWQRPASLWTGVITPGTGAEERHGAVRHFAEGGASLLVLITCEPVPAAGADALLVLESADEQTAAEVIEWALLARDSADAARPLVVVLPLPGDHVASGGQDGAAQRAAGLVRACALLDPALAERARQHPVGSASPWIQSGPGVPRRHLMLLEDAARNLAGKGA